MYTWQQVVDINALHQFSRAENKLMKARCENMQARKKLEEQAKEEYLNKLAAEEARFKKQEWQQAVDEANMKRFLQNGCTSKFNRALFTTHVQKENEAMLEFKREKKRITEEQNRLFEDEMSYVQNKTLREEQEKVCLRQLCKQTTADHNTEQIKKNKQLREEERQQEKEERERLRDLHELHAQELRHKAEKKAESKKNYLKCQLEDIASRDLHRHREAQKLNEEEKERKCVQLDRERKLRQIKKYQAEKFKKFQIPKEIVAEKLAVRMKKEAASKTLRQEVKLSKEVAEQDAKETLV